MRALNDSLITFITFTIVWFFILNSSVISPWLYAETDYLRAKRSGGSKLVVV